MQAIHSPSPETQVQGQTQALSLCIKKIQSAIKSVLAEDKHSLDLDLSQIAIPILTAPINSLLRQLSHLEILYLVDCQICSLEGIALGGLIGIDLSLNLISDDGGIEGLLCCPKLEQIILCSNRISKIQTILKLSPLMYLNDLNISKNPISNIPIPQLCLKFPNLEQLNGRPLKYSSDRTTSGNGRGSAALKLDQHSYDNGLEDYQSYEEELEDYEEDYEDQEGDEDGDEVDGEEVDDNVDYRCHFSFIPNLSQIAENIASMSSSKLPIIPTKISLNKSNIELVKIVSNQSSENKQKSQNKDHSGDVASDKEVKAKKPAQRKKSKSNSKSKQLDEAEVQSSRDVSF